MADEFTWPKNTTAQRRKLVGGVLWTIYLDGPFADETGKATGLLVEAMRKRGISVGRPGQMQMPAFSGLMNQLDREGQAREAGHYRKQGFVRRSRGKANKSTTLIELRADPIKLGPKAFPASPWPDVVDFDKPKPDAQPKKPKARQPAPLARKAAAIAPEPEPEIPVPPVPEPAPEPAVVDDIPGVALEPFVHRADLVEAPAANGQSDSSVLELLTQAQTLVSDALLRVVTEGSAAPSSEDVLLAAIPKVVELTEQRAELQRRLDEADERWAAVVAGKEAENELLRADNNRLKAVVAGTKK